tara:strand:+ start:5062 stop:14496 length:9435 start_codon:yes stop_codon:yes gene_type:complete
MVKLARRHPGLDRLIVSYRKKSKRAPRKINYRLILAHLLQLTRQKGAALLAYQQVIKRKPNHRLAHFYLASLFRSLARYDEALKHYEKALSLAKKTAFRRRCLKALGTLSLLNKKPKKALRYWRTFLALSPRNTSARGEIARSLARHKLYDESIRQWSIVLKRTRRRGARSNVLRQLGSVYELKGSWRKAVAAYRKAISYTQRGHWLRRELDGRILQIHRENGKLSELAAHLKKRKRKHHTELAMLARLLDEMGKDKEAKVYYKRALKANRRDVRTWRKYITLLEVNNHVKDAIIAYKSLIRIEPTEPRHRLAFAEMLSRVGKPKEALAEMARIARSFSRHSEILTRLAQFYRRRRMNKEAIKLYKRLIRLEPRVVSHRQVLGQYYYQQGNTKRALKIWQGLLRSGLPAHQAYAALGQIYREHDMLWKAHKAFHNAVKRQPKQLGYLLQLGEIYQLLQNESDLTPKLRKQAIDIWWKIYRTARLRSRKKRSIHQLFDLYQAQGTLYRLPARYKRKIYDNPRTNKQREQTIEALRFLGEYELWRSQRRGRRRYLQAKNLFQKILVHDPQDVDALLTLEQLASRGRRWTEARRLLLRLVKAHKVGRRNYYRRIYNYSIKLGDYKEAIRYGRKVVELNPDDASAHAELARIYRKSGRLKLAVSSYEEAVRLRPHAFGYRLSLASILQRLRKLRKALAIYQFVLKRTKDGRTIYDSVMQIMDVLGEFETKERERGMKLLESRLQSLADTYPRELAYFRALAQLYKRQGRMKEYRVAYLKAATTVDQKSQVYRTLAETALEQGNTKRAIIYFRKMIEESMNPSAQDQVRLARLYLEVNDKSNARKILLGLLNENPNSLRILRKVATLFYKNRLKKEAIRAYELFLELEPDTPTIRFRLAGLYRDIGQSDAAIGIYESILWRETHVPIRKKKKRVKRKVKRKKRKLPYYLRRRRRYYASKLLARRRLAFLELMKLYQKQGLRAQWERRLAMRLEDPNAQDQRSLMKLVAEHYEKKKWFKPLQALLERAHQLEPRNAYWIQLLARTYREQGQHSKALRLYAKLERGRPGQKGRYLASKIKVLLAMGDRSRLRYMLKEFLHNHSRISGSYHYILTLLEKRKEYALALEMLQWAHRYWTGGDRLFLIRKMVNLYRVMNMREKARAVLWKEWTRPKARMRYTNPISSIKKRREKILSMLWPLLSEAQRVKLLQHSEEVLLNASLNEVPSKTRRALIDAYVVLHESKGAEASLQYLPALWGLSTKHHYRDRYFLQRKTRELFLIGRYDIAKLLIRQQLKRRKDRARKMMYLGRVLNFFSNRGTTVPPRSFSRFLEQQLMSLKDLQSGYWKILVRRLGARYLAWGNHRRAIWWLERCRWVGGSALRKDKFFVLLLARAYKRYGNDRMAQKYYGRLLDKGWRVLQEKMRRHAFLKRKASSTRFRRRYSRRLSRFSRFSRRWRRRGLRRRFQLNGRLARVRDQLRALFSLYREAGHSPRLLYLLLQKQSSAVRSSVKELCTYYVLAGYSLDWATNKKMSSLTALLGMLRDLTKKKPYSNRRELLQYLASLEDAKGNVRQALALYRRLLSGKKQQRKVILWRMVYLLERAGDVRRRHAVLLRLSRQHKDGVADQLLAKSYRDRLQIRQAIVHYRLYIKRKKSQYPMRYYQRYGLGRAYKALEMAKFLMPSQDSARIEFFLRQALSGVRLVNQSGRSSYRYRAMVKEMMRLLSQSGRLSRFIASWQKRLKATPDQLHLLSLLRFAYEVKGDHDKYQAILVHILQRRPDEHSLLSALLFSYETYGKYKEAIALLNKLYKHSTNKPKDMALRLGDFYVHLGRKKMALAYWKKHFAGCLKLFSQYPKFRCGFTVGDRVVLAGMTQQALHMYTSTLKASSYRSDYQIRRALRFLIAKKDFAAALKVFERGTSRHSLHYLLTHKVQYIGILAKIYKGMGRAKKRRTLLAELVWNNYASHWGAQRAARILREAGYTIGAEYCYWQALWRSGNTARIGSYRNLCHFWHMQGLGRLCDGEALRPGGLTDWKSRFSLAKELMKKGHPQLALFMLRKAWPKNPKEPKLLYTLAKLSLRVGREDDARQFTELLAGLPTLHQHVSRKRMTQLRRRLRSKQRKAVVKVSSRRGTRLGRLRWSAYIPSFCTPSKRKGGERCKQDDKVIRCERHVVSFGKRLYTNDCRGRLFALGQQSGKVRWSYALPVLPYRKELPVSSSFQNRFKTAPFYRQFYWIADMKIHKQALYVAAFSSRFERVRDWGAGFHEMLHILKFSAKTGKLLWHYKSKGDFALGRLQFGHGLLTYRGRTYKALSLATGKTQWEYPLAGGFGGWLFDEKPLAPQLAVDGGFVVSVLGRWLLKVDPKGKKVWSRRMPSTIYSLAKKGARLYVVNDNDMMHVLQVDRGKMLWKKRLPGGVGRYHRQWEIGYSSRYQYRSTPVIWGTHLLFWGEDGYLSSYHPKDGKLQWRAHLADFGPVRPVVSPSGRSVAVMGSFGSLSVLSLRTGRLRWSMQFPAQIYNYKGVHFIVKANTEPVWGRDRLWLGWFGGVEKFFVSSLALRVDNDKAMGTLVQLGKKYKKHRMFYASLPGLFVDIRDASFRKYFLSLCRNKALSKAQRLRWAYAYLSSGSDLLKDLKTLDAILPQNIRAYSVYATSRTRRASGYTFLHKEAFQVRWMMSLWRHRKRVFSPTVSSWKKLLMLSNGYYIRRYDAKLTRRFLAKLLPFPGVGVLAAYTLAMWGDGQGRKRLFDILIKPKRGSFAREPKFRRAVMRRLVRWDTYRYGEWRGLLTRNDVGALQTLRKDRDRIVRWYAIAGLSHLLLQDDVKGIKKESLRKSLQLASRMLPTKEAVAMAIQLALLGDRRGVYRLRVLAHRLQFTYRRQLLRFMKGKLWDHYAERTRMRSYKGKFQFKLGLSSFRVFYANMLYEHHQYHEALRQFRLAAADRKQMVTFMHKKISHLGIAECLFKLGKSKEALKILRMLQRTIPGDVEVMGMVGIVLMKLGKPRDAKIWLRRALKKEPYTNEGRFFTTLARVYVRLGAADKAWGVFSSRLRMQPEWYFAYALYAQALMKEGKLLDKALRAINKAAKERPRWPRFLVIRAQIYHKMKKKTQAKQDLLQAIKEESGTSSMRRRHMALYRKLFGEEPTLIEKRKRSE